MASDLYYTAYVDVSAAAAVQVRATPYAVGSLEVQAPRGTTTTVTGNGGTWNVNGTGRIERLPAGTYRNWMAAALAAERAGIQEKLTLLRGRSNAGLVSLAVGVLGAVGAGAAYYLGSQAGADYDAAVLSSDAAAIRSQIQFYRGLFGASAGLGAAGLVISPFLIFSGSDKSKLEYSIANLDARIAELGK